jgi:hypothetical protein
VSMYLVHIFLKILGLLESIFVLHMLPQ